MGAKKKAVVRPSKPKAASGGTAKPTRKSSRSPPKVAVKEEDGTRGQMDVDRETVAIISPTDGGVPDMSQMLTGLRVNDGSGGSGRGRPSGAGRDVPKPYPVVYNGPVPRSIQDVDTPERLHQRRHCGRLFDGTVKYGVDEDGLRECLLIEFPEVLPFDRERLLKWKAAERDRIERGEDEVEWDWDDGMTDEERKKVAEPCTPADLEGMQAGRLRVYEDGFVEYILGGVRFEVTEGTDVLDRQDVYWADMNEKSTDTAGNECDISVYPMFTVKHRVIISPMIDELI